MSRLSERQRLVLFLRYYADLDYAAIAEALSISSGTVGAILTTARTALGQALEDGNWQAILRAAVLPAVVAPAAHQSSLAHRRARRRATFTRSTIRVATALAVLVAATALGVAWAAGDWTPAAPLALFEANPQGTEQSFIPGNLWHQTVIADSVKQVASVEIPKVGPIAFWHADTTQGGWCVGLRLSNGHWLGTGESPLEGAGVVPGCFPVQAETGHGVPVSGPGFDWKENDVDASSVGGEFWRIRYGLVTAPGAVKVTDLTSGQSTDVVDGDLFILAIQAPDPTTNANSPIFHLVAYDKAGNVVADDCPNCSG